MLIVRLYGPAVVTFGGVGRSPFTFSVITGTADRMLTAVDRELLLSFDSPTAPRSSAIAQMNVAPSGVPAGIDTSVSMVLEPPAATASPRLPINTSSVVQTLSLERYSPSRNG